MQRQTQRTDMDMLGEGGGGMNRETSRETETHRASVKQTASGKFLYDCGDSNQGSVTV